MEGSRDTFIMSRLFGSLRVGRQHLVETLVVHAALRELLLRQHAVVVGVHLAEDLDSALLGRVDVDVRDGVAQHVVDGLQHTTQTSANRRQLR